MAKVYRQTQQNLVSEMITAPMIFIMELSEYSLSRKIGPRVVTHGSDTKTVLIISAILTVVELFATKISSHFADKRMHLLRAQIRMSDRIVPSGESKRMGLSITNDTGATELGDITKGLNIAGVGEDVKTRIPSGLDSVLHNAVAHAREVKIDQPQPEELEASKGKRFTQTWGSTQNPFAITRSRKGGKFDDMIFATTWVIEPSVAVAYPTLDPRLELLEVDRKHWIKHRWVFFLGCFTTVTMVLHFKVLQTF
jgi:hypothetical protein